MFRKNEALLLLGVLLSAALIYGLSRLTAMPPGLENGAHVQIQIEGEESVNLDAGAGEAYTVARNIDNKECRNVIEITAEGVRMAEANCPDRWCVRKGVVPPGQDIIVCLPHRLTVRWVAAPRSLPEELDVVLQ